MVNNVLVLGSGAREHAIAWKLDDSPLVNKVFISQGNASKYSVSEAESQNLTTIEGVTEFCIKNLISLIVIGPEKQICEGWAESLSNICHVFAPNKICAKLEESKNYAKEFMVKNNIPTAEFQAFDNANSAIEFVNLVNWNQIVIKEDGLCSGKGVTIFKTKIQAIAQIKKLFSNLIKRVIVIEEFLDGYELSAMCFTDGLTISRLPLSQDHKRAFEGDLGENTGGMGAIAPIIVSQIIDEKITDILQKTIAALKKQETSYKGILYAGLMITKSGPKVLEFNCRFGDPETEVLLRLLNSDLYEIMESCCNENLSKLSIQWSKKYSLGVVMATNGYPKYYNTGLPVTEIPSDTNEVVTFYAGLKRIDNNTQVNSGGRVLCVTCTDASPFKARLKCLKTIELINFKEKHFRRDIGHFILSPINEVLNYSVSGVNVDEGNKFVNDIKNFCKLTLIPGTEQIGGFGALVDLKIAGFKQPQLIVGMDGIGTKLEIATKTNFYDYLGYDLVGMCVNDVLCHAAKPIAFLDYYVTGKLDRVQAIKIIKSISEACIEAGCALIGGETAEMPGVYRLDQWDIAGCCIGVRETNSPNLPQLNKIKAGDILIGLASNGIHSNGLSLVRKILESNEISLNILCPWNNVLTLGEEINRPTKIYVKELLDLALSNRIKAMAHITGGGIIENLPRCLPKHLSAIIDCKTWKIPSLFQWLKTIGSITLTEMFKTFNCGIGMILVIDPDFKNDVEKSLNESSTKYYEIGKLVEKTTLEEQVKFENLEESFVYTFDSTEIYRPRINAAILISGYGSNMIELIKQSRKKNSNCFISIVISNKSDAKGIEYARSMGVDSLVIPSNKKTREEFENEVSKELEIRSIELICLAGFMRILTSSFVSHWKNKIINIHPSLLPSFRGANAVSLALKAGVKVSGCTVHYVEEELDSGMIIDQDTVTVETNDDEYSLSLKIKTKEHLLYPRVMESVAKKILQNSN